MKRSNSSIRKACRCNSSVCFATTFVSARPLLLSLNTTSSPRPLSALPAPPTKEWSNDVRDTRKDWPSTTTKFSGALLSKLVPESLDARASSFRTVSFSLDDMSMLSQDCCCAQLLIPLRDKRPPRLSRSLEAPADLGYFSLGY